MLLQCVWHSYWNGIISLREIRNFLTLNFLCFYSSGGMIQMYKLNQGQLNFELWTSVMLRDSSSYFSLLQSPFIEPFDSSSALRRYCDRYKRKKSLTSVCLKLLIRRKIKQTHLIVKCTRKKLRNCCHIHWQHQISTKVPDVFGGELCCGLW